MLHQGGRAHGRHAAARAVRTWSFALLLALGAVLAACGESDSGSTAGTTTQAQGRTGGTVVWANSIELVNADPMTSTDGGSWGFQQKVYEGLVGVDDELKPTPLLATSWKQTSPTTYVFEIRRGVKFSNGREMTVDDVVGSLKRLADPKTASYWAPQLGKVKSITATGPWRVTVVLAQPNSSFLGALAGVAGAVMPMRELQSGALDPRKDMLGTGPYKVVSHKPNEEWVLARNPYYWQKGLPKVDKLEVPIMTDDAARVAGLRDGRIDVAVFNTPDSVKLLAGQANVTTQVVPLNDFYRLDVNSVSSVFKDPRLREALSLAIDRQQIVDVALAGNGEPTAAVTPVFGSCEPESLPYGNPDPERAAQLVEEAGAKDKTVSLMAASFSPTFPQIGQVLQSQMEAAGFKVKLEKVDTGVAIKRFYSGKADGDLSVGSLSAFADASMPLNNWGPGQAWNTAWNPPDKQLWALIDKSRTQSDGPARDATLKAACTRIAEGGHMIPLATNSMVVAYRSDKIDLPLPGGAVGYADPLRNLANVSVIDG